MFSEVTRPELELDSHMLPSVITAIHKALRLAVGKGGVYSFNEKAKFTADHTEEKDNSLLVNRSVAQSAKVNRATILRSDTLCPNGNRFQ